MARLFTAIIFIMTIANCRSRSLDQRMSLALEVNETDEVLEKSGLRPRWNNYQVPGFDEKFVKIQIDMILSLDEAEKAFPYRQFQTRRKRSAVRDTYKLWPKRIPFLIHKDFSDKDKVVIYKALQQWMQYTCLEFVPKQAKDYAYINFDNNKYRGCASFVGMQKHPQPIYLAEGCVYTDIVIHEIGHAIGLYHEHSRPDRDDFVTIYFNNTKPGTGKDFDKGNWSVYANYSKPYDYLSIMHYSNTSFSKNNTYLLTIVPTDESYLQRIGMALTLSYADAFIVNTMYQCSKGCAKKVCPKNGFLGKDCECYCPGSAAEGNPEPVKLCTHQTYCDKPDIDQSVYLVYSNDVNWSQIQSLEKDFLNGTVINMDFVDQAGCGYSESSITCINGKWEGSLPECVSSSCELPSTWTPLGSNKVTHNRTIIHGTNLSLSCPESISIKILTCYDGSFNDTETDDPYDVSTYKCSVSPIYRIMNEGRKCPVSYQGNAIYTIAQDNVKLSQGDMVEHLTEVTVFCNEKDVKQEFTVDQLTTYMICKDGNWDGRPPLRCPKAEKPCSLVTNAILRGPLKSPEGSAKNYNVKCLPGYTLNTQSPISQCTFEGQWKPIVPVCVPDSCEIPLNYDTRIITSDNIAAVPGMKVKHGRTVRLQCKRGEVADHYEVDCHLGKWNTPNNKLPKCRKVVCPTTRDKPVKKANYRRKNEYVYGDSISIDRCPGNLELSGPSELKCERDGTWSATVTCKKFCQEGNSRYTPLTGKTIKGSARRTYKLGRFTIEACTKKCNQQKRFLCRAVSYGYRPGQGIVCELYDKKITEKSFIEKANWEVSERKCLPNKKG